MQKENKQQEISEENLTREEQELKQDVDQKALRDLIAKSLYKSEKTDLELKKEITNVSYEKLMLALKNMLALKLIKKQGFPVKYSLSQEILDTLEKRKKLSENDKNVIKVEIIIESKADDKTALREMMEKLLKTLKEDESYLVYDANIAEIVVHDSLFSTYISAQVSCLDLFTLFKLIYFYGVTSIEILKPDKLMVPISDLQNSLHVLVDMVHGYTNIIYDLKRKNEILSKKV